MPDSFLYLYKKEGLNYVTQKWFSSASALSLIYSDAGGKIYAEKIQGGFHMVIDDMQDNSEEKTVYPPSVLREWLYEQYVLGVVDLWKEKN